MLVPGVYQFTRFTSPPPRRMNPWKFWFICFITSIPSALKSASSSVLLQLNQSFGYYFPLNSPSWCLSVTRGRVTRWPWSQCVAGRLRNDTTTDIEPLVQRISDVWSVGHDASSTSSSPLSSPALLALRFPRLPSFCLPIFLFLHCLLRLSLLHLLPHIALLLSPSFLDGFSYSSL